ncbi:MAG: hypothetical protein AAF612_10165 [Planctomycetota bacterium]
MTERPKRWNALGDAGVIYADLSGYSQLVYQCASDPERLDRLALGMARLLQHDPARQPDVEIEGYAGDGFVALCLGDKPARQAYGFAQDLHQRFHQHARPLLMDLGFRVDVRLRTAFDVGKAYRVSLDDAHDDTASGGAPGGRTVLMSESAIIAARIASGQCCRRFGAAMSRRAYKRLLMAGGQDIREPDEVILDRNRFPEPIDVYRLHEAEAARIDA